MVAPALLLFVLIVSWSSRVVESSIPRSSSGTSLRVHPSEYSSSLSATETDETGSTIHSSHNRHTRPAWNMSPKINHQGYLCEQLYRRIPGEWEADCPHTSTISTLNNNNRGERSSSHNHNHNDLDVPVIIRQVPGDGDCLFHAVAISLNLIQGNRHLNMDSTNSLWALKDASRRLRQMAVECLRSSCPNRNDPRKRTSLMTVLRKKSSRHNEPNQRKKYYKRLFVQGYESMATSQLLSTAASQYGISSEEYCDLMEQDSYWGGGPEIVALCNVLKRPIHVYELVPATSGDAAGENNNRESSDSLLGVGRRKGVHQKNQVSVPNHLVNEEFCLRRMATFGSPKYDSKEPLRILSADSRFPDVRPECIRENGNHFMAIFPVDMMQTWVVNVNNNNTTSCCCYPGGETRYERFDSSDRKRRRVRGGAAANSIENGEQQLMMEEEPEEKCVFHKEWFDNFHYSVPLEGKNEWNNDDDDVDHQSSSSSSKVSNSWCQKLKGHYLDKKPNQWTESSPSQQNTIKQVIGSWLNVFVWTLSHFHRF